MGGLHRPDHKLWRLAAGSGRRRRRIGRCRLGFCRRRVRFLGGFAAALEIGRIPAAALQLKARGAHLLGVCRLAAGGANRQWRIGNLQHFILRETATRASIRINRHKSLQESISCGIIHGLSLALDSACAANMSNRPTWDD